MLVGFVQDLLRANERIAAARPRDENAAIVDRRHALLLADAALRYAAVGSVGARRPLQVAVLGPTQTGKSTVVNLLLGQGLAAVSPLAGYTIRPHGFWIGGAGHGASWTEALFPGWQRCDAEPSERGRCGTYGLALLDLPATPRPRPTAGAGLFDAPLPSETLPQCVIWDTPDFDSLSAESYARGVFETAALADVYVLVLSREKYSDLSAWHFLQLIEPLGRPLVICLNKLTPDAEEPLTRSLQERLHAHGRAWEHVTLVRLPYDASLGAESSPASAEMAAKLRAAVVPQLDTARLRADESRRARQARIAALLRKHWADWLEPVRAEEAARAEWQRLVAHAAETFVEAYRRDYLDHPQRYDSFRRAAIELLNLLEIPGVGAWMARVRNVVTWPARQVVAAGRSWWRQRQSAGRAVHSLGTEATVLVDTLEALLSGLLREVTRRYVPGAAGAAFWRALAHQLSAHDARLRESFETALHEHHADVTREIQAAANALFAELARQPARLNALRTARATIDLASIVLAVKTGGLTPLDAVWAPAAFGVASLLMEGITGLEMGRADRRLRARQLDAVRQELVQNTFVRELTEVAERLEDTDLFGIATERVAEAAAALDTWEAGDE